MKRVLHLRSSGGMLGAENVILEICKYSMKFGIHSSIGIIKNENDPIPEFMQVAIKNQIETIVFNGKRSFDPLLCLNIGKKIKEKKIDIIHCHGYKEDFYGLWASKKLPVVATNHLWKRGTKKSTFYALIDALILKKFNQVVGVSDDIVDEMKKLGIRNPFKISNGVDINRFNNSISANEYRKNLKIDSNKTVVGMISSLTPEKGHDLAITAMEHLIREYPDLMLLIAGDGILKVDLQNKIKNKKLKKNILLLGSRKDIPEILSVIDIFLLPSYIEGMPMALLEAMAAGKAVIATTVGDIPRVIKSHKNGILINPGNAMAVQEALSKLISANDLRKKMGINARNEIINNFSSQVMTRKYCRIYDSLL